MIPCDFVQELIYVFTGHHIELSDTIGMATGFTQRKTFLHYNVKKNL